jgi:hypothetical protein
MDNKEYRIFVTQLIEKFDSIEEFLVFVQGVKHPHKLRKAKKKLCKVLRRAIYNKNHGVKIYE